MASSSKSRQNRPCPVLSEVERQLGALNLTSSSKVLLAYSGGLDSSVLLHAMRQIQQKIPFQLSAMHVHHGLSPNADDWAAFCQHVCKQLSVQFLIEKVTVDTAAGLGVEAAAREARYAAMFNARADWLVLAQHQDDQAETLLMQLARGAGVKGLCSMAPVDVSRKIVRPLLSLNRAQLAHYAKQHQLQWVEDESNVNTAFDRNWWRVEALPLLKKRYPAIVQTLSRSARHLAEASTLLDELAAMDAAQCVDNKQMHLPPFTVLNQARQRNLLRWWLMQHNIQAPSEARLLQLCSQLANAGQQKTIHVNLGNDMELRTYQGCAYLLSSKPARDLERQDRRWQGELSMMLEDGSKLVFDEKIGQGIALRFLDQSLNIRYRQGGEKIKLDAKQPSRSLKVWFQMSAIPPWQRANMPLLYLDNVLAGIPNLGCATQFAANSDEIGLVVNWLF